MVTDELEKQSDIFVPSQAYDPNIISTEVLSETEVATLIDGLGNILNAEDCITNINLDNITTSKLRNAKGNIKNSYVLNATITNQLEQQSDIAIPENAYEDVNAKLLVEEEIDNLVEGLINLLGSDSSVSNINIDDIKASDIKNAKVNIQTSLVLNATITKQLDGQADVIVPEKAYEDKQATVKLLTYNEIGSLIDGLVSLLGEEAQVTNINLDNIKTKNMKDAKQAVQTSLILNATITKQLDGQSDVVVPSYAYKSADAEIKELTSDELGLLIDGLVNLLGEEATVTNINVDEIKAKNMKDSIEQIKESSILRATSTKQLDGQADVVVPSYVYVNEDVNVNEISKDELEYLVEGLVNLLGEETSVNDINVDNIKAKNLSDAKEDIESSSILRATITKQLDGQADIAIPESAYDVDENDNKVLLANETGNLISGLVNLLGEEAVLTSINVNEIKTKNMQDAKADIQASLVLNATITKQLDGQESVKVPSEAYVDADANIKTLKNNEIANLIDGLVNLLGEDATVNSINVDEVTTGDIKNSKNNVIGSLILNATITDQLSAQSELKIPANAYQDDEAEIKVLTSNEVDYFITGLVDILGGNEQVSNIQVNNIVVGNIYNAKSSIQGSLILNATISNQIESNGEVVTPESAFEDADAEIKLLTSGEIDNLVTGLNNLLGSTTKINNIQVSNITVDKIESAKTQISNSHILNATITKQLDEQEENLVVPSATYVDPASSIRELKPAQMTSLLSGVAELLPANNTVSNIDVNGLKLSEVKSSKSYIADSYILRATITKHINSNDSIVVPEVSLDDSISENNKEALKPVEVNALIDTLIALFGENREINNLPVNTLSVSKLNDSVSSLVDSYVLKATITKNLKDKQSDETIVIPSLAFDEYEILSDDEITSLFGSLDIIFGDATISNISSFSNIDISTINANSSTLANSYVIRSTISRELIGVNDIVVPVESIDSSIVDYKSLTKDELKSFFGAIATMGISNINNISASSLTVDENKASTLVASDVMRATITKNVKVNDKDIYALKSTVEVTKDVKGNNILVLNEAELSTMITSLNVLSTGGSVSVTLDINALVNALQSGKLEVLLNSNSIRIVVSELLVSYASNPSSEAVYKLPNSIVEETKQTMTKQEIINIVTLLSMYYS